MLHTFEEKEDMNGTQIKKVIDMIARPKPNDIIDAEGLLVILCKVFNIK